MKKAVLLSMLLMIGSSIPSSKMWNVDTMISSQLTDDIFQLVQIYNMDPLDESCQ